jgi:hypothetical protein
VNGGYNSNTSSLASIRVSSDSKLALLYMGGRLGSSQSSSSRS